MVPRQRAGSVRVDYQAETLNAGGRIFKKGDVITIDGSTGQVLAGAVAMQQPELSGDFAKLMEWADAARRMRGLERDPLRGVLETRPDLPGVLERLAEKLRK